MDALELWMCLCALTHSHTRAHANAYTRSEAHQWIFWASRCSELTTPVSIATDGWMNRGAVTNKHPFAIKTILTFWVIFFYGSNTHFKKINKGLRQMSAAYLFRFNGSCSCNNHVWCLHTCGFHNLERRTDGGWVTWLVCCVAGSDLDRTQYEMLDRPKSWHRKSFTWMQKHCPLKTGRDTVRWRHTKQWHEWGRVLGRLAYRYASRYRLSVMKEVGDKLESECMSRDNGVIVNNECNK